jgi:hypothetical protein
VSGIDPVATGSTRSPGESDGSEVVVETIVEVVVTGSEVVVEPAGGAVLEVVEGPEEHAATRATRRIRDRRIGGAKGTLRIAATRRFTATFGPTSPGGVGCLMQS